MVILVDTDIPASELETDELGIAFAEDLTSDVTESVLQSVLEHSGRLEEELARTKAQLYDLRYRHRIAVALLKQEHIITHTSDIKSYRLQELAVPRDTEE